MHFGGGVVKIYLLGNIYIYIYMKRTIFLLRFISNQTLTYQDGKYLCSAIQTWIILIEYVANSTQLVYLKKKKSQLVYSPNIIEFIICSFY